MSLSIRYRIWKKKKNVKIHLQGEVCEPKKWVEREREEKFSSSMSRERSVSARMQKCVLATVVVRSLILQIPKTEKADEEEKSFRVSDAYDELMSMRHF